MGVNAKTQKYIENRILEEAEYIIKTHKTVREVADVFKLGKTTIHEDMSKKLKKINSKLYIQVSEILSVNLAERSYRKGRKYLESLQGQQIC